VQKQLRPIFETTKGSNNAVPVEKLLFKAVKYWPSFLLSVILAIICGYIYLEYSTPAYMISAKVFVKDERKGGMIEGQMFEDMGIKSGAGTVDNEIEIFKSRILMRKVVEALHLNVHYYTSKQFKTVELYEQLSYRIKPLFADSLIGSDIALKIVQEGNSLQIDVDGKTINSQIGDTIKTALGSIAIIPAIATNAHNGQEVSCVISPVLPTVIAYINALEVVAVNKQVSIVKLSLSDIFPERGKRIINTLVNVYMQASVDDKNRVAESTMDFIDDRLQIVSAELSGIEGEIKDFKQDNNLTNVTEQSKLLLDYTSDNTKQLSQQEIQLTIVKSLEEFLEDSRNNGKSVPSTFFVQDLSLTALVNNYNNLQSQKQKLLLTNSETSPFIDNINDQLLATRLDIKNNLASLRNGLAVGISEVKKRVGTLDAEIRKVPAREKIYLEYARQQNIKQELYLYLLKKREETAISKSSTTPNARIIDVAESDQLPYSPNKTRVILSAIVIGLLLPSFRVAAKELLSRRIGDRESIEELTHTTILGEVGHSSKKEMVVVKKDSRAQISEQFRQLRTNLQFLLTAENEKTVLITSSMSGEGKSFISVNLATTLALSGKKVILLELDLRKPKISAALGIAGQIGFSNYSIGGAELDEIIKPTGILSNFYIIPSGAVPPNPAELVMLPRVEQLFKTLKTLFDVIIIDSAPVGLVTDAQLLGRYADVTLYIARQGITYKQQLRNLDALAASKTLPRINLVINDVENRYGIYGYGNYGNGYYEEESGNRVKELLKKIKKPS
jgi:tyrosine-protein kinase Etk/Wzc